jgi:hypothetical protein
MAGQRLWLAATHKSSSPAEQTLVRCVVFRMDRDYAELWGADRLRLSASFQPRYFSFRIVSAAFTSPCTVLGGKGNLHAGGVVEQPLMLDVLLRNL